MISLTMNGFNNYEVKTPKNAILGNVFVSKHDDEFHASFEDFIFNEIHMLSFESIEKLAKTLTAWYVKKLSKGE